MLTGYGASAGRLTQRELSQAFGTWLEFSADHAALRAAAAKAMSHWCAKGQAAAFQGWHAAVQQRTARLAAAARAAQYFLNRTSASAFAAWKAYAARRSDLHSKAAVCIQVGGASCLCLRDCLIQSLLLADAA